MNAHEPLTVLLVEDDPAHVAIVRRNVPRWGAGIRLEHAPDGEAALAFLRRKGAGMVPPALVLLDLRLPRMDGLEVLATMKADPALARIPVVIMTTSSAEADIARAYDRHANSYLVKPLDFDQFTALLKSLGHYWLGWNHRSA